MKYGIIISNEIGIIETLRFLLRDFACLKTASKGWKNIRELLSRPVDFIILDSLRPGSDQLSVLNELLSLQKTVPVIVLVPSIHSPLVPELKREDRKSVV